MLSGAASTSLRQYLHACAHTGYRMVDAAHGAHKRGSWEEGEGVGKVSRTTYMEAKLLRPPTHTTPSEGQSKHCVWLLLLYCPSMQRMQR